MGFYETPAFFMLLALAAIPAVVLGIAGKSNNKYGFAVSVVFLLLLFSRDLQGLACFAGYVAWACLITYYVSWLFSAADGNAQRAHAVAKFRVALALAIAPLAIYKVSAVFDENLLGFLGISYITFKVVQVLLETRDGLVKRMGLFSYLYFLLFFTPFTSGPIMRSREFEENIATPLAPLEYKRLLLRGVGYIVLGAVYKFVLAALASWALWFLPSYFGAGTLAAVFAEAWSYVAYMFFDFAGYSAMAVGAGALFGVKVPMNFNKPFLALDMKDFWNRWHMSLSYWLRDYVFMRFSRACISRKVFKSRVTVASLGFMINMVLMGAWHGLTPDYLVYGFYHGALLALTEIFQRKSKFYKAHKKQLWFKAVSWVVTMHLVMFGLMLFSGQALSLIGGM